MQMMKWRFVKCVVSFWVWQKQVLISVTPQERVLLTLRPTSPVEAYSLQVISIKFISYVSFATEEQVSIRVNSWFGASMCAKKNIGNTQLLPKFCFIVLWDNQLTAILLPKLCRSFTEVLPNLYRKCINLPLKQQETPQKYVLQHFLQQNGGV